MRVVFIKIFCMVRGFHISDISDTTDKKIKISSYIRKFRVDRCKVIYGFLYNIQYEEMLKYLVIYGDGEAGSHI
jgi:hypothetical protein